MKEAFEHMAECLMNYMTDIKIVEVDPQETQTIKVQGILTENIPMDKR